ncbi:MAG: alkaline phosphatase [Saprospiraceae bacterium]|nr:alkaline phosphatase [Saprospiraceae bacterium]
MVSDGMSQGTLTMADLFVRRRDGKGSFWMDLYRQQKVSRALMDTASASSLVTDSAAASSAWGGGHRVKNGRLNLGDNGEEYLPILQKFKKAGKKVGCVTTVPITHATPAGFCVVSKTRGEQAEIADQYLKLRFDVMMGGGLQYFTKRADKRNLLEEYKAAGYHVATDKLGMLGTDETKPVMCVFADNGLPYELDREMDATLKYNIPSLAEMTKKAIQLMKDHPKGFVMQVEGGKVDWAAHANDSAALIYDQIAFDQAVKAAVQFAEEDGNTLVIITSDHGNANPGLYYGKDADKNFEKLFQFKSTNDQILMNIKPEDSPDFLIDKVRNLQNYVLSREQAIDILASYKKLDDDKGYNPYKLPYEKYGAIQAEHTSVAFGSNEHSADYTELAMFGPGSELLKPFVLNTDLHYLMLQATGVANVF